jgi:pimeloyl-ACP methyl ester carboxylesterase
MSFHLIDQWVVEETGSGSPVVCVHGLGGSSNTWSAIQHDLGEHRLVRIDLPGSGRSPLPDTELSMDLFVDGLLKVCQQLGISQAQWLGHSMGTIVCQHLAIANPGLVRGLVLFGPVTELPEAGRVGMRVRAEKVAKGGMQGMQEATDALLEVAVSASIRRHNPSAYAFVRESLLRQSPRAYAATCLALAQASGVDIENIRVPALLISGDEDKVAPPDAVHAMARRLPYARAVVLPRCGHWTPIEKPQDCAREARYFLNRHA